MIPRRTTAFTLVELAIIIALIGGCLGLLLPFVEKAREKAYRAKCEANLRRLSVALYRYAADHNDSFPAVSTMGELVAKLTDPDNPYIDDLSSFTCPNTRHGKGAVDYMYISGLSVDAPSAHPLCADKVPTSTIGPADNHGTEGINVLYVTGEVRWRTGVPAGSWIKE